ncbi:MAG TPA: helix-turn-helix domain-containing protein [Streptosporangiaceae bacterium]
MLDAAVLAFSGDDEAEVTLEAIARDAGVGIGTLYRHFPTREALVEAAYRNELARLCGAVPGLLAELPPDQAVRTWMDGSTGCWRRVRPVVGQGSHSCHVELQIRESGPVIIGACLWTHHLRSAATQHATGIRSTAAARDGPGRADSAAGQLCRAGLGRPAHGAP